MRTKTLSSDILEAQFGPTVVEVLHQDGRSRIICTKAAGSGQVLEISWVRFMNEDFQAVWPAMAAGASMGKAFREAGVEFVRDTTSTYHQALPDGFRQWFNTAGKATIVAVTILAGPDLAPYAEILETYSPAVNWPRHHGKPAPGNAGALQKLNDFLLARPR